MLTSFTPSHRGGTGPPLVLLHGFWDWLPHADWIELEGVGHCPPLVIPLETAQPILGFTDR